MFHVIIIFCCSQSYTGNILVSVNPYKMFDIYGLDMVKKYENQILGTLPPWVVIFEFSWVVVYCSLDFVVALVIWLWYCIFSFYPLLFCLAPSQWKPHSRSAAEIWRAGLENRCCATMWSVYSILFSKTTWQKIFFIFFFFVIIWFSFNVTESWVARILSRFQCPSCGMTTKSKSKKTTTCNGIKPG